jgi:hypothetical protein
MTRIPRAGSSVPQAELEAYIRWGSEVSELVRPMAQKISSQIVPLLAPEAPPPCMARPDGAD